MPKLLHLCFPRRSFVARHSLALFVILVVIGLLVHRKFYFYHVSTPNKSSDKLNQTLEEEVLADEPIEPPREEETKNYDASDNNDLTSGDQDHDVTDDGLGDMVDYNNQVNQEEEIIDEGDDFHLNLRDFHGDKFKDQFPPYPKEVLSTWTPRVDKYKNDSHTGAFGNAAQVSEEEIDKTWHLNEFSLATSDLIPVDRFLPDYRAKACQDVVYPKLLPTTAIIIVFHNEAWSTLIRTIVSIVNRSPLELIDEIILVDDFSDLDQPELEHLGQKLEDFIENVEIPSRIIRMVERKGLIQARLVGAKEAKSPVLTFLDSHVECTEGWLEPLLAAVKQDRRLIMTPTIPVIDTKTFQVYGSPGGGKVVNVQVGIMDWNFEFAWKFPSKEEIQLHEDDPALPYANPIMAGGLFSVDKEFFYFMGAYDEEMEFWGGENIETSLRMWTCGGTLWLTPCSSVAHIFRITSPHKWTRTGGIEELNQRMWTNIVRTLEVWGDADLNSIVLTMNPQLKTVKAGDVSVREALKEKLVCHDFKWFLEKVFYDSGFNETPLRVGEVKNLGVNQCLDSMMKPGQNPVGIFGCHHSGGTQGWVWTKNKRIRKENCLIPRQENGNEIWMIMCKEDGAPEEEWGYNTKTKQFIHSVTSMCLGCVKSESASVIKLVACNDTDRYQQWEMMEYKPQPK